MSNLPQARLSVLNPDGTFQLPWYRFFQQLINFNIDADVLQILKTSLIGSTSVEIIPDNSAFIFTAIGGPNGGVSGPVSSLNNELAAFLGTAGNVITNTGCVPTANGLSLISAANYAAMRTLLSLGALATQSTITASQISDPTNIKSLESLEVACSNETTTLTTGTSVVTFWIPYNFTATQVFIANGTVSSSGVVTTNLKQNGTTVFSTNPSIGASQNTSLSGSGSIAAVLSVTSYNQGDKMTVDITAAGTGAAGLKLILIGHRT